VSNSLNDAEIEKEFIDARNSTDDERLVKAWKEYKKLWVRDGIFAPESNPEPEILDEEKIRQELRDAQESDDQDRMEKAWTEYMKIWKRKGLIK
jgi:hypothetical protein